MLALPANRYVLPGVPPPEFQGSHRFSGGGNGGGGKRPPRGTLARRSHTKWCATRGPTPLCWPRACFLPRQHSMVPNVTIGAFRTLQSCAIVIVVLRDRDFFNVPTAGEAFLT